MTTCLPAADCNGQGGFDLTDAIFTLQFVFFGGVAPPAPFPDCGVTADERFEECPGGSTICEM